MFYRLNSLLPFGVVLKLHLKDSFHGISVKRLTAIVCNRELHKKYCFWGWGACVDVGVGFTPTIL